MRVIIDIDGTLCFDNKKFFFQLCNTEFSLGIAAERCTAMTRVEFLNLPEMIALRSRLGPELLNHQLGWLAYHPQALLAALPMRGAVEGVARLAELGPLSYYTARFSHNPHRQASIVSSTHQWLTNHQFTNPLSVVFCDGIQQKLHLLFQLIKDTGEQVVLVDDSYERILANINALCIQQRFPGLLSKLILVAIRAREVPTQVHALQLLALPSWDALETIIQHIKCGEAICP